jgi:hypothetical protein
MPLIDINWLLISAQLNKLENEVTLKEKHLETFKGNEAYRK